MLEQVYSLREVIESCFGKKVLSYGECVELQHDIYKKTETLLSINTLRRFFGLIKSNHKPSLTTLNTLATYCGYSSATEFQQLHQSTNNSNENLNLLKYMIAVFKDTVAKDSNDATFINLVYNTILFLNRKPEIAAPFQRAIAKTKNGQLYYFETFVNMDKLDGYFGNGLPHYLAEKKTKEAQIFGNAVLALRYWLTNNDNYFLNYSKKVLSTRLTDDIHPFVCGRYYGIKVLYEVKKKGNVKPVFKEARNFYNKFRPEAFSFPGFPCFEFTYSLSLLFAGEWEECLYFVDEALSRYKKATSLLIFSQYFQSLYLFKALALASLQKGSEASNMLRMINQSNFFSLDYKLNSILLLKTKLKLQKIKSTSQLEHLIEETRFRNLSML